MFSKFIDSRDKRRQFFIILRMGLQENNTPDDNICMVFRLGHFP